MMSMDMKKMPHHERQQNDDDKKWHDHDDG